ncbi:PaaX family transcriptional regulator C-terminal domain-containing protein [Pseudomonas sp. ATCC 13867]|uniref:PaaX family transcriptional regulator C-terminal domain-containing protein n=1 Tax=Pseudomonas sp. ATCC 13867 TaxID=1294143 RepID=UPI00034A599A|nr:PaaX family transcriptional regulator C-terminal domain-containing protein [Pseudomonas sp. ATCC 13867]RFQ18990.1 PaaX family transcriptional regulator [Pseudomonas sp. ATCC 13867]
MTPHPRDLILKFLLSRDDGVLSARDAISACALFGIRENSVRVALVRLAAAGMIEAAGRGDYCLGAKAADLAEDVRGWRNAEMRIGHWHGAWVVAHCAGLGRTDRAQLRRRERALELLGFRELERELFIRPDNLVGGVVLVRERLLKLGLESSASVFLAAEFDPMREVRARALWDGKVLNRGYRETAEKLGKWLTRVDEMEVEVAARESFLMGNAAIRQLIYDPLLPEPLVNPQERHAFIDVLLRYDDVGHAIWRGLRASPPVESSTGTTQSPINH